MANRRPLVVANGEPAELSATDTLFMDGARLAGSATFTKTKGLCWNDDNDSIIVADYPTWEPSLSNVMTLTSYQGSWAFRNSASGQTVLRVSPTGSMVANSAQFDAKVIIKSGGLELNAGGSAGTFITFSDPAQLQSASVSVYYPGATQAHMHYRAASHLFLSPDATQIAHLYSDTLSVNGNVTPATDNARTLGTASLRWSTVYAASGAISTSDANDKTAATPIDDALLDAWAGVRWVQFQFLDAVKAKGADRARFHWGVIAQSVRDVFAAHSIDGRRYGVLCFDSWDAVDEVRVPAVPAQEAVPATEGVPDITDEYGRVLSWAVEPQAEIPATPGMPERVEVEARAAGCRWGIRYDLAQAIEAAFQRRRADRVEARLAAIEAALASA